MEGGKADEDVPTAVAVEVVSQTPVEDDWSPRSRSDNMDDRVNAAIEACVERVLKTIARIARVLVFGVPLLLAPLFDVFTCWTFILTARCLRLIVKGEIGMTQKELADSKYNIFDGTFLFQIIDMLVTPIPVLLWMALLPIAVIVDVLTLNALSCSKWLVWLMLGTVNLVRSFINSFRRCAGTPEITSWALDSLSRACCPVLTPEGVDEAISSFVIAVSKGVKIVMLGWLAVVAILPDMATFWHFMLANRVVRFILDDRFLGPSADVMDDYNFSDGTIFFDVYDLFLLFFTVLFVTVLILPVVLLEMFSLRFFKVTAPLLTGAVSFVRGYHKWFNTVSHHDENREFFSGKIAHWWYELRTSTANAWQQQWDVMGAARRYRIALIILGIAIGIVVLVVFGDSVVVPTPAPTSAPTAAPI